VNLSPQAQASASATVLEVRDLRTIFRFRGGTIWAVNGVSFSVAAGELLGVVGESGSGKSVTMMSHGAAARPSWAGPSGRQGPRRGTLGLHESAMAIITRWRNRYTTQELCCVCMKISKLDI